MSAKDQMKSMLDQLMGTSRDGDANRSRIKFSDPQVCKSFLLKCCPHEILQSTRMDLGECPKLHDVALRADFEMASANKDYFYDIDAMEHLQSFIRDCDKRTEQAKTRLAETQEELSAEVANKANAVHELAENIGKKLAKAEQLGAEGLVEESIKLMDEVEQIRRSKMDAEMEYRNSMPASTYQQQKLRVCEVCSAYLGIHDNDRRLADHFGGKLHLGFISIREKLTDLEKSVEERRKRREEERQKEREARGADRRPGFDRFAPYNREDGNRGREDGNRGGYGGRDYGNRDYRGDYNSRDRNYDRRERNRSRSRSPRSRSYRR